MSDSAPFGDGFDPYAEQRDLFELLSQETRHLIVQTVLGHPEHLVSLDELAFAVGKSKPAILDQLEVLRERELLQQYDHPDDRKRGHPESYYGPTEYGVEVLDRYNYLRAVPVLRALYDNTAKPAKVQRHESAPRPSLPDRVRDALQFETPDDDGANGRFENPGGDLDDVTPGGDGPAVESSDGDLTSIDELFED